MSNLQRAADVHAWVQIIGGNKGKKEMRYEYLDSWSLQPLIHGDPLVLLPLRVSEAMMFGFYPQEHHLFPFKPKVASPYLCNSQALKPGVEGSQVDLHPALHLDQI